MNHPLDPELSEWFEILLRDVSGGLGHMKSHDLSVPRGSSTARAIIPTRATPIHLLRIDRAMRRMIHRKYRPWFALGCKLTIQGGDSKRAAEVGVSKARYATLVEVAYGYLEGYFDYIR